MTASRRNRALCVLIIMLVVCLVPVPAPARTPAEIPAPAKHFGFRPGADRMLLDYESLIDYMEKLDAASDRLALIETGTSPFGRPIYIAFISSEENIRNLSRLKEINRRLALDTEIPGPERESMIEEGKVFFLAALSMHSGEVGPSQSAPLIAYDLVTTPDPDKLRWLDDVVYMMVPCHNPDGMDMIVEHYCKYRGTKYEGSSMPGVYHKYVGHDNNRDFVSLTQADTKAIAAIYSTEWYPQVMVEKHQMGSSGARYFVPLNHDPIAENVAAGIWNWNGIFGSNMIKDMTKAGLAGISQHYLFDNYWPGSTETCIWKNVIGFLTEAAGVQYATPVYVEPSELRVWGKGLSEYKKSINMPHPWPGGWWRLSDIMDYEITSTMSILKTASLHRKDILRFRNDICCEEVKRGRTEPPFYFIMPLEQHDRSELVGLVNLLTEHGVRVYRLASPVTIGNASYEDGDIVVPLAQPYRAFVKEVLEHQEFPVRHYTPGGEVIKPYDITSWSLPLHRGVTAVEIDTRSKQLETSIEPVSGVFRLMEQQPEDLAAAVFPACNNESFKAAFMAMELGLEVSRLKRSVKIQGTLVQKGSFVIYVGSKQKKLGSLIDGLDVAPLYPGEKHELDTEPVTMPRIALVETWFHDMDAGWTRYVFDTYHVPFTVIRPNEMGKTDLAEKYDVVVFPNTDKYILMSGKHKRPGRYYMSSYPPEYVKGMGEKGMKRLMTFLDGGGTVVSWGRSTGLFIGELAVHRGEDEKEEFQLPVRDISDGLSKDGLYCPGCLVRVQFAGDHPLTIGMPEETGVLFMGQPVFTTSIPRFDMDRRVIGLFPSKDILLSGYIEKGEKAGNKAAMVWLRKGKGQIVLFAFNPQFRASTNGTFKLIFNSLLLPEIRYTG